MVRVDVEVVDRLGDEREHEPDRAAENEGEEDVGRACAGAEGDGARPGSTHHHIATPVRKYIACSRWSSVSGRSSAAS